MTLTEAKAKANRKWNKENLERIYLTVRKGEKDNIIAAAKSAGESVNKYIISSVEARMQSEKQRRR